MNEIMVSKSSHTIIGYIDKEEIIDIQIPLFGGEPYVVQSISLDGIPLHRLSIILDCIQQCVDVAKNAQC